MSARFTLPSKIPELVQIGSPVYYTEALIPGVVLDIIDEQLGDPPILSVALSGQNVLPDRCIDVPANERHLLVLNLHNRTGLWHAALWAAARQEVLDTAQWADLSVLRNRAERGWAMTPAQINALANYVLLLAGEIPPATAKE